MCLKSAPYKKIVIACESILTWYKGYHDQTGGSPRKKAFHCISVGLSPAIAPNVGNFNTQFICVWGLRSC